MAMEVSGSMSVAAQAMSTNKTQAGFDVLTKTLEKTEQMLAGEQRLQIAEQTGKGLNIDVEG
jgi:hypothetical protein